MSNDLTKDEVSAVAQKAGCAWLHEPLAQRFATICRAPLVAEVERLKKDLSTYDKRIVALSCIAMEDVHELLALQADRDDWKARALKAEQAGDRAVPDAEDYDLIDRYLRNNLDDADYGEYLAALDRLVTPQPAAQEPTSAAPVVRQMVVALELPAPTARFNWNLGKFEWLVTFKHSEHHLKPLYTHDQLLQYGDARALAAREQAIEEWRVHLLALWEKGDFDLKDALAASPQEQT